MDQEPGPPSPPRTPPDQRGPTTRRPKPRPIEDEALRSVRREIALSDRRAALDSTTGAIGWLAGSLLLLNGGGILVLAGHAVEPEAAGPLAVVFLVGLFATLTAAAISVTLGIGFAEMNESRLGLGRRDPQTSYWRFKVSLVMAAVLLLVSFVTFAAGSLLTIARATEPEPVTEATAPPASQPSARTSSTSNEPAPASEAARRTPAPPQRP